MAKYPLRPFGSRGAGSAGRKEALLMDRMPFYLVVFQSIPETAILISLGLTLLGFKPKLKSVLVIASLESLVSFLIRSLPLLPGVNVFLQLPVLIVLTACCCGLSLLDAALASLLGLVVLALTETAFNFLISAVSGIAVRQALEGSPAAGVVPTSRVCFSPATSIFPFPGQEAKLLTNS